MCIMISVGPKSKYTKKQPHMGLLNTKEIATWIAIGIGITTAAR